MLRPQAVAESSHLDNQLRQQVRRGSSRRFVFQVVSDRFLCLYDLVQSQEQRVHQIPVGGGEMYDGAGVFVFDIQSAQQLIQNAIVRVRHDRHRSECFSFFRLEHFCLLHPGALLNGMGQIGRED